MKSIKELYTYYGKLITGNQTIHHPLFYYYVEIDKYIITWNMDQKSHIKHKLDLLDKLSGISSKTILLLQELNIIEDDHLKICEKFKDTHFFINTQTGQAILIPLDLMEEMNYIFTLYMSKDGSIIGIVSQDKSFWSIHLSNKHELHNSIFMTIEGMETIYDGNKIRSIIGGDFNKNYKDIQDKQVGEQHEHNCENKIDGIYIFSHEKMLNIQYQNYLKHMI